MGYFAITMDTADHLEYRDFESPICFRVRATNGVVGAVPSYTIHANILEEKYGLDESDGHDVALFVDKPYAEFAFDGSQIDSVDDVISSVRDAIDKYNEVPDELSEEEKEEYEEHHVELEQVSRED